MLLPRLRPRLYRALRPPYHRTLIAAPKPNSGPLLTRRPDRALPPLPSTAPRWLRTLPLFALLMAGSCWAIFNYQKSSSSVVAATLYALRTHAHAREVLGDDIYFASRIPWVRGEINQVQGRVDVRFWVKGTRGRGELRFRSLRRGRLGVFETVEWSLQPEGQERISLLPSDGGQDPFQPAEQR